jgi:hypothetical protein
VERFLDEPGLEEIPQLHPDRSVPLFVKVAQPLLHDAGVR